ncbi:MAG TPA: hypothetical protein DEG69_09675, partial [Flavobacteriaceae bacterium]|nr:hypothetical protein [Flavobacteriaceae bacterium]
NGSSCMKLNLSQRKFNQKEIAFLLWFLRVVEDNPIENPVETTVFHYDDAEYSEKDFVNFYKKVKAIYRSYQ